MTRDDEKEKVFNEILERLCEGELISHILKKEVRPKNYPGYSQFFEWLKDEERANKYARAREIGIEIEVDEIKAIADGDLFIEEEEWTVNEAGEKKLVKVVKKANYQQKAQMIDARKWRAGKMSGKYSNKQIDLGGAKRVSIVLDLGDDDEKEDENEEN